MKTSELAFPHSPAGKTRGGKPIPRMFKVPVKVYLNDSQALSTEVVRLTVIAPSAAAAADWVRDTPDVVIEGPLAYRAETEIFAYGPRGGEIKRYVGWKSSIENQIIGRLR